MTEEEDREMEETRVRMIQGILKVFGMIPERAAVEYNVALHQMRLLLQRPTFQSDSEEERGELSKNKRSLAIHQVMKVNQILRTLYWSPSASIQAL